MRRERGGGGRVGEGRKGEPCMVIIETQIPKIPSCLSVYSSQEKVNTKNKN